MSDTDRDLHGEAYREWRENRADEFAAVQRKAFLAGFEAAADESKDFRHLRQWIEDQRDSARDDYEQTDDEQAFAQYHAYASVLVKLMEMGCEPRNDD